MARRNGESGSEAVCGYHGRYLRVDLTSGDTSVRPLSRAVLQQYVGGIGLGTWLLLQECPDGVDPLSPEAPLIFAFSPLVGSPLTTSAKFAVLAKSPLTGRINDSLSSSGFAIAGKRTGFDAIVITGRAERPTCLVIDSGDVRLEPADEWWDHSSSETESGVRQRLGNRFRVASIGVAGENLVRYATLSHDGRHAARGGLGAVMGAKRLKAVAVAGDRTTPFAHPQELVEYSRRLSQLSFGPATAKYRELGTVSNLLALNRLGSLPTRNFQQGEFAGAARIAPEQIEQTHSRTRASCAACTIGCEHIFQRPGQEGVRLEYETLYALGPLCGIDDAETILTAARRCDELGLDTISLGATVAFAMECAERGMIDEPDLRFGNGAALLNTLERVARRAGVGDLLADGVRVAAEAIGQGASDFAPHVKGLEVPGYEPRALPTMALGLAVAARGADHNRSGAYQVDLSDRKDRLDSDQAAALAAIETENEAALMDSLILCKFLRGVFEDRLAAMAEMLRLVTGWEFSTGDMEATAQRIITAKKLFNIRQGWTPAEDTLPERFFAEPLKEGASAGARLTRAGLARRIRSYNLARGWDAAGWVSEETSPPLDPPSEAVRS